MDDLKISEGVRLILEGLGEDLNREGLKDTPRRVAAMYQEIFSAINEDLQLEPGFSEEVAEDLIILKNIPFYSMCEHHMLPFFGKVHLVYVPKSNKVSGFSSLTRLVDHFSKRLQIQERFTQQIANTIKEFLDPQGVGVQVEAQQLCVSMRGSKKDSVRTVTQAVRGELPDHWLELIK